MATVMNVNHFSIYLKRNMECTVILPSDMKNDEKLPVLWLSLIHISEPTRPY